MKKDIELRETSEENRVKSDHTNKDSLVDFPYDLMNHNHPVGQDGGDAGRMEFYGLV